MGLIISTEPVEEPVSMEEFRIDRRITDDSEDTLLRTCLIAARIYTEKVIARQLVNATYVYTLSNFPNEIRLPMPPLSSVTSIQYVDTDGATQTLSAATYTVVTNTQTAGGVVLAYNQSWPTTRDVVDAVTVTYVAGYGANASAVPDHFRKAIMLIAGGMFEYREDVAEKMAHRLPALDRLLSIDKVYTVV